MKLDQLSFHQSQQLKQKHKMVQSVFAGGHSFTVSGVGYNPRGNIYRDRRPIDPWQFPALEECLIAGLLCNNSQLVQQGKQHWIASGDADEVAMIALAYKAGLERSQLLEYMPRIATISPSVEFISETTLHGVMPIIKGNANYHRVIYARSMTDCFQVLSYCEWSINLECQQKLIDFPEIAQKIVDMRDRGLQVIILTKKNVSGDYNQFNLLDLKSGLTFVGLMGLQETSNLWQHISSLS